MLLGLGALVAVIVGILIYAGLIVGLCLLAYYFVTTVRTLKQNSQQQTELLQEIKRLLEKTEEREESDDVI